MVRVDVIGVVVVCCLLIAFSVQSNLSRTSNFFSSGAREIFVNELPFVHEIRIKVGTNS